jgi:hypothetical protein
VLAYHRYRGERWKATELTYAAAVIIDSATPAGGAFAPVAAAVQPDAEEG